MVGSGSVRELSTARTVQPESSQTKYAELLSTVKVFFEPVLSVALPASSASITTVNVTGTSAVAPDSVLNDTQSNMVMMV